MGFRAGDVNLYRFVGNHPTNATDPSGLQERPGPKPVDPGGTTCKISESGNRIRLLGPNDKPTLLKDVPFWRKDDPLRPLDKKQFAPYVLTGDRGWCGVIPKGAHIGPDGCGPCVGIALIPPKQGQPVYIMHFSALADVTKGFEEVGFVTRIYITIRTQDGNDLRERFKCPSGYEAVICGALMPEAKDPDFTRCNNQRLYTLEGVVNACRQYNVKIRCFVPTSGFAIDADNNVWWTTDPAAGEGDRYDK